MKPYDATIGPVENMSVSVLALGEGFHNYHHTFPHDYSASEWRWSLNLTTLFIDAMAWYLMKLNLIIMQCVNIITISI